MERLQGPVVELREVVGCVAEAIPLEAQPADVGHDGIDVLLLLFFRVRVVEAQVGLAAEFVGQTKVDADGLGVADVEVAVGLGRKAGLDDGIAVLFGAYILGDLIAEEVRGSASVLNWSVWAFRIRVGHGYDSLFHGRAVRLRSRL
jgi:hypothetical protein